MKQTKIKQNNPIGFSHNVQLMIGGLKKHSKENNYNVKQARLFYSVIKAAIQDSFNTWAATHILNDLPLIQTINDYEKKENVSNSFKELKPDIIKFLIGVANPANIENFMLAINEVSQRIDNHVIMYYESEPYTQFENAEFETPEENTEGKTIVESKSNTSIKISIEDEENK